MNITICSKWKQKLVPLLGFEPRPTIRPFNGPDFASLSIEA